MHRNAHASLAFLENVRIEQLITAALMARLTISLSDRDHIALKLLAIRERKRLTSIVAEAISFYLSHSGAYGLTIANSAADQSKLGDNDES